MNVTLINYTADAVPLLIFTKHTRLTLSPGLLEEIKAWPLTKQMEELQYIAKTIPSSWEFVDYTFLISGVSRAYTHQQVRTRTGSYAQQTMRMLDMGAFDFVWPAALDHHPDPNVKSRVQRCLKEISEAYCSLRAMGIAAEDCRSLLPTNVATNIVCKFNLRTLADLVASRTGGRTQSEYQAVVNGMMDAVLAVHPWANMFLTPKGRDYFADLEAFAQSLVNKDMRVALLKIIDKMRKR